MEFLTRTHLETLPMSTLIMVARHHKVQGVDDMGRRALIAAILLHRRKG